MKKTALGSFGWMRVSVVVYPVCHFLFPPPAPPPPFNQATPSPLLIISSIHLYLSDTVIMNSNKRVQDFLPSDPDKHLLVSEDSGDSDYNAGVWLVRNSKWTRQFLKQWWNTKAIVLPTGTSNHGDNDACTWCVFELSLLLCCIVPHFDIKMYVVLFLLCSSCISE